jgi:DNA helicase-2/ATP-dependent DNA helicase PcrA
VTDPTLFGDEMLRPRVSSLEIAAKLGLPEPTAQQQAVIEADFERPSLVIAGAGSGKTETMANRVLWLLANRIVRPGEVLGLTFTRKAAGELTMRVRDRIAQLRVAGLTDAGDDELDLPEISTYNSYANMLYRDNASVLGREADGTVLGAAAAWQLARTIVTKSADARLLEQDRTLDALTEAVLTISRALADNMADREAVRAYARQFAAIADLPAGHPKYDYDGVLEPARNVGELDLLVDLAAEYEAAKIHRGFIEYSDQVALALEIIRTEPRVAGEERARHRVVLLDEYQDTSVTQTWLLSELFHGHPVMAVGDPNQSIYGWRGASASNLESYAQQFGQGPRFSLSTSWRNGTRILGAANTIVAPFNATRRVPVAQLEARPGATELPVEVVFAETIKQEADAVARWLKSAVAGRPVSAAMLMRARRTQSVFLAALREHDVRYHVLGLGGLLSEPEIADLVSALQVVHSAEAGMELLRLLAGSRWRLGVKDLFELGELSSLLAKRGIDQRALPDEVRETMRNSLAGGERGSLVDALDFLATAKPDRSEWERFSPDGAKRLRDAGRTFAKLRTRAGMDLPDFVAVVVQELQLDIEVAANRYRTLGPAPLEAFFDALSGYLQIDDVASLGGFLSWLREAEKREDLSPRPEDPEPGTVQVLTIHGAKGLEWDIVAVPRLVDGELPAAPQSLKGWLSVGQLPWEFRGDAADLPLLAWRGATTRKEYLEAESTFRDAVRAHEGDEERRLAYVAVTRAKDSLLLSGAFWGATKKMRKPSPFLLELAAAGVVPALPAEPDSAENPLGDEVDYVTWPFDPLGGRRRMVEAAAEAVRTAPAAVAGPWSDEVGLLLEERRKRLAGHLPVVMPTRVPASRFKEFLNDPASVAAGMRRPMPERPYRATQLGTLFHAWVEDRYGAGDVTDELDALAVESDVEDYVGIDDEQLAALKRTFEASPWAGRRPVEVEREIHLPFAGRIVICKIDAVYEQAGRFQVVDWKTGKAPKDAKDLEEKQLQLALYRLAYAQWRGIDPSLIDAVFYYVADDRVIEPERIYGEQELLERWRSVFG